MFSFRSDREAKGMVSSLTVHVSWDYNANLTFLRGNICLTTDIQTPAPFWLQGPRRGGRVLSQEVNQQGLTCSDQGRL